MREALRGVVLGVAIALLLASCIVKKLSSPRLTGTCEGACAHYVACKPGHPEPDRVRCEAECPEVFSDRDSLETYESLSCRDAVEYIDGDVARTARPAS